MGFYSRNDRNVFAAAAAEEERRRLGEQAAGGRMGDASEVDGVQPTRGRRLGWISRIAGRIRSAIGR